MKRVLSGCAAAAMLMLGSWPLHATDGVLTLRSETVAVYAADGRAVFRSGGEYAFRYARNAGRRAYEWDPELRRVRISPDDGEPAAWLACDTVVTTEAQCGGGPPVARPSRPATAILRRSGTSSALPLCPGDARCP